MPFAHVQFPIVATVIDTLSKEMLRSLAERPDRRIPFSPTAVTSLNTTSLMVPRSKPASGRSATLVIQMGSPDPHQLPWQRRGQNANVIGGVGFTRELRGWCRAAHTPVGYRVSMRIVVNEMLRTSPAPVRCWKPMPRLEPCIVTLETLTSEMAEWFEAKIASNLIADE